MPVFDLWQRHIVYNVGMKVYCLQRGNVTRLDGRVPVISGEGTSFAKWECDLFHDVFLSSCPPSVMYYYF